MGLWDVLGSDEQKAVFAASIIEIVFIGLALLSKTVGFIIIGAFAVLAFWTGFSIKWRRS